MRAVQVAPLVDARALDRLFDYAVPDGLADAVRIGSLVACPLRGGTILGVVISRDRPSYAGALADLAAVVTDAPPIPGHLLDLARWVSRYYATPLAACLRVVLPPGADGALRREPGGRWRLAPLPKGRRQLIASEPVHGGTARHQAVVGVLASLGRPVGAADLCRLARTTLPTLRAMAERGLLRLEEGVLEHDDPPVLHDRTIPTLTDEQRAAVDTLSADPAKPRLLHGVTGSGKTEVYLRLIADARSRGLGSLVLVPEIALTPQIGDRLVARLGAGVVVWHSGLSVGERARADARIRAGTADVVIGARSAVFAPFPRLGLIVVDEEHDGSYKQDSSPRYDARQVAYRRAAGEGARLVYGSATPRPESWYALEHVTLTRRADGAALPNVKVVDMRTQAAGAISRPLAQALQAALARDEKAILLLNRRGLARQALCRNCGWIGRCPRCDVPLVVHGRPARLLCHHCGYDASVPNLCPSCGSADVIRQGTGTQGLEEALAAVVPGARMIRLDSDAVVRRGELERRLREFRRPGGAVLFGTQMVAKGHDLPDVTVAAVLDADGPLQQPDFRAEERAFSLIVQLAGRAGRRGEPATVFVQAWEPDGRAIRLGARHAVPDFLEGELERRREHGFPPFGHLVRVVVDGSSRPRVQDEARAVADAIAARLPDARLFGPVALHRVRERHRSAVLVRGERAVELALPIREVVDERTADRPHELRIVVDVDPQDT